MMAVELGIQPLVDDVVGGGDEAGRGETEDKPSAMDHVTASPVSRHAKIRPGTMNPFLIQ